MFLELSQTLMRDYGVCILTYICQYVDFHSQGDVCYRLAGAWGGRESECFARQVLQPHSGSISGSGPTH